MGYRAGAAILAITAAGLAAPAAAKTLPGVQLTPSNQPRQCTTPGRLQAFLRQRNPRLLAKYDKVAVQYMRHGRDLGIRWDYAFFQMVVETNSLKFTGDVHPRQNNFAGLGATGGGVKGESFRSVSDGVRAHQQHLMIYAGIRVNDPVADRTRKVQAWGILDKWRKRYRRSITFSDVGSKWAPYDRGYASDIQSIANAFYTGHCNRPDPRPDLLAEAKGNSANQARTAYQEPRYNGDRRAGLGARNVAPSANYRTLNASSRQNRASQTSTQRDTRTAAKFATPSLKPAPSAQKCRVWTASYGGQKATIIRSKANRTINYTVLDVNNGREDAETRAYIAAYAKGGRRIGDFPTKSAAMDKAFKLCPKG
ncbi:MAG: glucosaminidase domain-containing protein [Hyphomicrobiaceae bacterium]